MSSRRRPARGGGGGRERREKEGNPRPTCAAHGGSTSWTQRFRVPLTFDNCSRTMFMSEFLFLLLCSLPPVLSDERDGDAAVPPNNYTFMYHRNRTVTASAGAGSFVGCVPLPRCVRACVPVVPPLPFEPRVASRPLARSSAPTSGGRPRLFFFLVFRTCGCRRHTRRRPLPDSAPRTPRSMRRSSARTCP